MQPMFSFFKRAQGTGLLFVFILLLSASCRKADETVNIDSFIAHAGGSIEGYKYTNSLEAINLSYQKGCRLFELDLILTADNQLVAAHSWSDFKKMTDFPEPWDDTPLTEEQFLSLKIHNQYRPMNMDLINEWFRTHPDAILVTDKINSPESLLNKFLFKDRLIMELFSWEAVNEAIELDIIPMPSEDLILSANDIEKTLSDLNIEHIAVSQNAVSKNLELFKKLKARGIKTYVYSLTKKKDESYILKKMMDYVYGMYVDNMDILSIPDR